MTEWLISGNPKKYDFINAFRDLKKINWKQSANIEKDDIVYIYVSDEVKSIKLKCKVNDVNIKTPNIDSSAYDLSNEFNKLDGRYMELEMIEEFDLELFSKPFLEKYGFSSPQGPIRVGQKLKQYLDIVEYIIKIGQLDPYTHDGSYEMVNEIIKSYAAMEDLSAINYKDLNLVYLMTDFRRGIDVKRNLIKDSNLNDIEKNKLTELLDFIWNKAEQKVFSNQDDGKTRIGLFVSGFSTFENKTDDKSAKEFIKMCIDIQGMIDEEEILNRCAETLKNQLKGMRAASFSMVLHCLNPYVFPIFTNKKNKDIFEYFGLDLKNKMELENYIENVQKIKEFRDKYFKIKNYRVFDLASWQITENLANTNIDYLMILNYLENNKDLPYTNPLKIGLDSKEKEKNLELKNSGQLAIAELKKIASLCKESFNLDKCEPMSWLDASNTKIRNYLWCQLKYQNYSNNHESISIFVEIDAPTKKARYRLALEIKNEGANKEIFSNYHKHLDLPIPKDSSLVYISGSNEYGKLQIINDTSENIKLKLAKGEYKKVQISKIIPWREDLTNEEIEYEILEGISELIPYYEYVISKKINKKDDGSISKMQIDNFSKNIILYGPPGTGKTYDTVIYAVAIIENKKINEIKDEVYDEVLKRYKNYKNTGLIAFTTFHQSYGYEEFIEGIKPVIKKYSKKLEENNLNEVEYTIEDGIFKKFCNDAANANNQDNKQNNYVFIIDEINRGNISKIFGELITLIEEAKRKGEKEEISALLPYSKEEFSVPSNVYIIGTMNTADRSIAIMDTALRRRFDFIEMMPDVNVLKLIKADKVENIDIAAILEKINERIEFLYDKEHTIGHAFFTKLAKDNSLQTLKSIFEKSVIPLLQEYFYEDYQKIQFVLGDNEKSDDSFKFIVDKDIKVKDIFKGNIEDIIDLKEKKYYLNKEAFSKIESYKEII